MVFLEFTKTCQIQVCSVANHRQRHRILTPDTMLHHLKCLRMRCHHANTQCECASTLDHNHITDTSAMHHYPHHNDYSRYICKSSALLMLLLMQILCRSATAVPAGSRESGSHIEEQSPKLRLCSKALAKYALEMCGGCYHLRVDGVGLAERCCFHECTRHQMQRYCCEGHANKYHYNKIT